MFDVNGMFFGPVEGWKLVGTPDFFEGYVYPLGVKATKKSSKLTEMMENVALGDADQD